MRLNAKWSTWDDTKLHYSIKPKNLYSFFFSVFIFLHFTHFIYCHRVCVRSKRDSSGNIEAYNANLSLKLCTQCTFICYTVRALVYTPFLRKKNYISCKLLLARSATPKLKQRTREAKKSEQLAPAQK